MNLFCLTTFSINYFELRLALSFWFFQVEVRLLLWHSNWFRNEISLTLEANSGAYSAPCQISKMGFFAKIGNDFSFFTIFVKSSILDVWQHFEFASEVSNDVQKKLQLRCSTGFWIRFCRRYLFSQKMLAICLLNLINIFHHASGNTVLCTVISTWPMPCKQSLRNIPKY